ncbi:hypothetical protein [Streptomyces sp. NPDC057302]|uniref:hypothetical protein n=1 Tax=Streptomyces sp. NPDC057302 TaxID=3346094 RepID=UPI00363761F0
MAFSSLTSGSDISVGFYVLTSWSGLGSYRLEDGRPLLFRTVVQYAGQLRLPALETTRYWAGRASAVSGHREVVDAIAAEITDVRIVHK